MPQGSNAVEPGEGVEGEGQQRDDCQRATDAHVDPDLIEQDVRFVHDALLGRHDERQHPAHVLEAQQDPQHRRQGDQDNQERGEPASDLGPLPPVGREAHEMSAGQPQHDHREEAGRHREPDRVGIVQECQDGSGRRPLPLRRIAELGRFGRHRLHVDQVELEHLARQRQDREREPRGEDRRPQTDYDLPGVPHDPIPPTRLRAILRKCQRPVAPSQLPIGRRQMNDATRLCPLRDVTACADAPRVD